MASAKELESVESRVVEYVPFGESSPIRLTLGMVRQHIAVPTKSGAVPSDTDLIRFMMLCKAGELNPWTRDAYLVGYDGKDGPQFSLITAIQALLKRAEANPNFDGMESGIVVMRGDNVIERRGNLIFPGETLYGGWARLWRKDRSHDFYDALSLATFNTGRSQWAKDAAGMIDKCAQASVLRLAFPSQLGSLYIEQERGLIERKDTPKADAVATPIRTLGDLTARIGTPPAATAQPTAAQAPPAEQEPPKAHTGDVMGVARVIAEFNRAKSRTEIDFIFDSACGPDSAAEWSTDDLAEIKKARAVCYAALQD